MFYVVRSMLYLLRNHNVLLLLLIGLAALFMAEQSYSQGNGDAGLQSSGILDLGALGDDQPTKMLLLETAALGPDKTICLTTEYRLDWNVWGGINIWFALPYNYNIGNLAFTHGLGDLRAMASIAIVEKEEFTLILDIGGVLPSGKSDLETDDGKPLPMVYQPSQGNAGFIAGMAAFYHLWSLSAGYQNHLSANENHFTRDAWNDPEKVVDYPDSPGLWCGDDISLRLQKSFLTLKAHYYVSAVSLYRLNKDRILQDGELIPVDGTDGFSMNLSAGLEVKLGKTGLFRVMAAMPVFRRESYPDGLNRDFTLMAGFGLRLPD
jgi:hypothetical protein